MLTKLSVAVLLVSSLAFFGGGGNDNNSGENPLTPPVASPAQNSSGKVEVGRTNTNQEFSVTAKKLPNSQPPGPFEVWMEDAGHVFFKVGNMQSIGNSGQWRLHLETTNGLAPVALGVADVADLTNRIVQVKDTGGLVIYLAGTVPTPDPTPNGGNANKVGPVQTGAVALQRPMINVPDANAAGKVTLRIHGDESEFEIEAEHLDTDANAVFSVHIQTAVGSNAYYLVGPMTLGGGKNPRWRLELESEGAPSSELAVASLTDLAGRILQIRDKNNNTVLSGHLPAVTAGIGKGNFNKKDKLERPASKPSPKAHGWTRSKFSVPRGASTFEIRAMNLTNSNTYDIFMETAAGGGVFTNIGSLQLKGNKALSGTFKRETEDGDTLPFGVSNLIELSNRAIEIRDGNGNVHLTGLAP